MTITATLARVRDRDAKATPGPWEWDGQCYILAAEGMVADTGPSPFPDEPMGPDDILQARGAGSDAPIDENMALVAAYRTDAVTLAKEVERLNSIIRKALAIESEWRSLGEYRSDGFTVVARMALALGEKTGGST